MLNQVDALLTLAEVAASFAGFAALVTLFARRRIAGTAIHDMLRLRLVIGASVVTVIAALVPVALAGYGLSEGITWRIGAGIFLALIYFTIGSFLSSYQPVRGVFAPDRLAVVIALTLELFIQISLGAILFGFAADSGYGLYISALIGTIAQAAFVFLRLVESTFASIVILPDDPLSTND
jgi:hypothetical protein